MKTKEAKAVDFIRSIGPSAVAFSGGADSSLVCSLAKEALGTMAIAVTCDNGLETGESVADARKIAREIGIEHFVISCPVLRNRKVAANLKDRCYHCKRMVFGEIAKLARSKGFKSVLDGSTADDSGDFRPGSKARDELHVRSPLRAAGIAKEDVKALSRRRGLSTWSKPSAACLASRIPYGTMITEDLLNRIAMAEGSLRAIGFARLRVRAHGDVARIEVGEDEIGKAVKSRKRIADAVKKAGFAYATIDLEGYRTGSMNEVLGWKRKG